MTDHGHDLLFGTFLTPDASRPDDVVALAQVTEAAGLDLVTVQDHPYQARFLDTWTLLSVIAARTSRVRVAPNVANLPLRPPAVLARSVASLDLLTGGRVELGLGAGGFLPAVASIGGPRLDAADSVTALEEGIAVIRGIWAADARRVDVEGRFHRVHGAHPGPAPAHDVAIWLGAVKPRMLGVTGRLADGWLASSPWATPDVLPGMNRAIDEAAEAAGRRPGDVRRLYNVMGRFSTGGGFLDGPPALWAEQLAGLALEQGLSAFVLAADDAGTIRRFAEEVVPAVRELVATGRATGAGPAPEPDPEPDPGSGERAVPAVVVRDGTVTARVPAALGVAVTPDDGARHSAEVVWDEATRPSAPAADPGTTYSARQRASGQHLVDIHDHLRAELDQVRGIVAQVLAGAADAGAARDHINAMTMRQNTWTMGGYCESYCRVVTIHHTLEDRSVFPPLRRADPALAPVLDRLSEEHLVIHGVLERVDRALVAFAGDPGRHEELRAAVDLLTDALLSHLSYEERELVEPLARFSVLA